MTHPILPAGYNSWENDGDEVDGSGVNETIAPVLFDSFVGLPVLVIDTEMLAAFDEECPDLVVARVNDQLVIPHELETLVIR
jgi:hypothetical protein